MFGPAGVADIQTELATILGASSLPGELRRAVVGAANIAPQSVDRAIALAAAAVTQCNRTEAVRVALADLAADRADPARYDAELIRIVSTFPNLSTNLPRLFRAELDRI